MVLIETKEVLHKMIISKVEVRNGNCNQEEPFKLEYKGNQMETTPIHNEWMNSKCETPIIKDKVANFLVDLTNYSFLEKRN